MSRAPVEIFERKNSNAGVSSQEVNLTPGERVAKECGQNTGFSMNVHIDSL